MTHVSAVIGPNPAMITDIAFVGLVWTLLAGGAAAFTLLVLILTRD